eukprot:CAMPEP_0185734160 /NCGR_PEP_ID=MMETSP1171-20130828/21611_1 /TAXON_ID=374046 /ORGANISM="Helicotheca tamensis, Strain CCMP826" /LENGTH=76 /DNA_ID=CAMNT_0028404085 /DNA_START=83 /DNA_END=313 /DNA_ORIENTATION=+
MPIILLVAAAVAVVVSIGVYFMTYCKRNTSNETAKDEAGFDNDDYDVMEKEISGDIEGSPKNNGDDTETIDTDEAL